MDTKQIAPHLERLMEKSKKKLDQAEVFCLDSRAFSLGYRNGELREMEETQDAGIGLRAIHNGRLAMVTSSNMDKINAMTDQALELSRFGEKVSFSFPEPREIPCSPVPSNHEITRETLIQHGKLIVDLLHEYSPDLVAKSSAGMESLTITLLNSEGFYNTYTVNHYNIVAIGVIAEENNILMTYRYRGGQELKDDPALLAQEVIQYLEMGRRNIPFSGCKIPVLFTPGAISDIMSAFGAGITGAAIAKGVSPLVNKIGEKIIHESLSIIDDGLFPLASGSQPFDDEGIPCCKKYLIENGVLKNYLLDLKSASKLGMTVSGNGFRYTSLIKARSYVPEPSPSFTNLIIPEGSSSHQEILAEYPRVLLIDQLTGVLLGNLINGDWSGNVEYGILFERGEPVGRIKNAMTGGNFYQMFSNNYVKSSSDREWVTGFGGGSGSSLFPYILFDGITISA